METPTLGNRVLEVFVRENPTLKAALQRVSYEVGRVIYRQDRAPLYAYFPSSGVLGLTIQMRDGAACQATAVGDEGLIGLPIYLGLKHSPYAVVQQVEGSSYRLAAPVFVDAIRRSPLLQEMMDRYCAYTIRFGHQSTACNSLHSVRQRACRWLLLLNDRVAMDNFDLPQAMLADMIGVRRQSISEVCARLRRDGLIEYSRGRVTIVNRRRLEHAACCECFGVMNMYYERLLGDFFN